MSTETHDAYVCPATTEQARGNEWRDGAGQLPWKVALSALSLLSQEDVGCKWITSLF